jgi:hypothetical protein
VKIQSLSLIGCACQCSCWRHCFEREDFLQGENLRSVIGWWQRFCIVSFLEASLMEKLIFWCCLGDSVLLYQVMDLCSGTFFIFFLFFCCMHSLCD